MASNRTEAHAIKQRGRAWGVIAALAVVLLALPVSTLAAKLKPSEVPLVMAGQASKVSGLCLQAGKPHAEEAGMRTPGKTGQAIHIKIHFAEWPTACAAFRRIEQYQIMIKGKDGLRPFSPPFFWDHNGAYTSNEAGDMGGSFKKPPNSPDSTVRPGEKALLMMRERIQRLSDKKIVAEVIRRHKITNEGPRRLRLTW